MHYDWTRFKLKIPVNASPDVIYMRWSTSSGLLTWFLREASFQSNEGMARDADEHLRPGDRYTWRWFGYPDDVSESGIILSANHRDELSFSFGQAGKVGVRLHTIKQVTVCELEQYDIPTDEYSIEHFHIGCMKGWLFYLTNLKSILERGVDLRNRDVELTNVINS